MAISPEKVLHDYLIKSSLKLTTAESCTGGLISHRITDIPGSSEYFAGGLSLCFIRSQSLLAWRFVGYIEYQRRCFA